MVPDHAPIFVGVVAPDGEHAVDALVGVGKHAIDEVCSPFRLGEVDPGMQCPVGIPQRKDCMIGEAVDVYRFWSKPRN